MLSSFSLSACCCKDHDLQQLSKFYFDTCNILDECYRQVFADPAIGPALIPMQIALTFANHTILRMKLLNPEASQEICRICNIPDSHLVKRFLQEQSFLFHTWHAQHGKKLVFTYSAPLQLRNFFFDPGRSRHLYSVP
jgi:hypothetical protein